MRLGVKGEDTSPARAETHRPVPSPDYAKSREGVPEVGGREGLFSLETRKKDGQTRSSRKSCLSGTVSDGALRTLRQTRTEDTSYRGCPKVLPSIWARRSSRGTRRVTRQGESRGRWVGDSGRGQGLYGSPWTYSGRVSPWVDTVGGSEGDAGGTGAYRPTVPSDILQTRGLGAPSSPTSSPPPSSAWWATGGGLGLPGVAL